MCHAASYSEIEGNCRHHAALRSVLVADPLSDMKSEHLRTDRRSRQIFGRMRSGELNVGLLIPQNRFVVLYPIARRKG